MPACANTAEATYAFLCHAVNGEWTSTSQSRTIPDPMNGEPFIRLPDTQPHETEPFVRSLRAVPKSGLHNPLKNPERCGMPSMLPHVRVKRMHASAGRRLPESSGCACAGTPCMAQCLQRRQRRCGNQRCLFPSEHPH